MTTLRTRFTILAAVAACLMALPAAQAAVVIDHTPTGTRHGSWSNNSAGQNFLVQFTLASSTDLNGFDIFTDLPYASVGTSVTVKIRNDVAGLPAAANLFEFIDAIDSSVAFSATTNISSVDFSPLTLGPGTYWMGVSGTATELSWVSFNNGGTAFVPSQKQLTGNGTILNTSIYDFAYRIRGVSAEVPEPDTLALTGLALAGLGALRRRG